MITIRVAATVITPNDDVLAFCRDQKKKPKHDSWEG